MQLLLMLVGAFVRAALISWSTTLIQHQILTPDQGTRLVVEGAHYAVLAFPGLLALGWSGWQKYRHYIKLSTALELANRVIGAAQRRGNLGV